MSEMSAVRIKVSREGYTLINNLIEMQDAKKIVAFSYFKRCPDSCVIFGYDNYKWNNSIEKEVILSALDTFDKSVLEEPMNLDRWFYKSIEVDQNNNITIRTNDRQSKFTGDFYPVIGFSL